MKKFQFIKKTHNAAKIIILIYKSKNKGIAHQKNLKLEKTKIKS